MAINAMLAVGFIGLKRLRSDVLIVISDQTIGGKDEKHNK